MFRRIALAAVVCLVVSPLVGAAQQTQGGETPELVDINSAPVEQIQEVVGDELLAEQIVQGRPYANKRQLLTRDLVTAEEYERIRELIVARRIQETP